jgi:uncharacterized protein (DUF488 family)
MQILTIGHSTRSAAEFLALLKAHSVTGIADVRTIPRSRRHPHFSSEALSAFLSDHDIAYIHLPGLGGLRKPRRDSPNAGWKNESFRGYADHMQTPEFASALEELLALARKELVAVMCAEAVPWRCHRSLIADALLVRGVAAEDIATPTRRTPHKLTPFARVRGTEITYPGLA